MHCNLIKKELETLHWENEVLKEENQALHEEIATLKDKLPGNGQNSYK
jgi:cell division protein FtsB